jgi:hypothetical protein
LRPRGYTPCNNTHAYPLNPRTATNRRSIFSKLRMSTRNGARPSYVPLKRSTSSVLPPLEEGAR